MGVNSSSPFPTCMLFFLHQFCDNNISGNMMNCTGKNNGGTNFEMKLSGGLKVGFYIHDDIKVLDLVRKLNIW